MAVETIYEATPLHSTPLLAAHASATSSAFIHQAMAETESSETDGSDAAYDEDSASSYGEDVDHAGWEDASGDLTKRYNRLRQHIAVASTSKVSSAPLPAINRSVQRVAQPEAPVASTSANKLGVHTSKLDSSLASLAPRYASLLNLEPVSSTQRGAQTRKGGSELREVLKDKSDRATSEQVLDDRTRLVLYKMLNRHILSQIEGCVSTGKEANVYHALGPTDPEHPETSAERHLALKVYKTSILIFKDRDRYVTGEHRFKSGYARSNPRKMVRLWAEKELRNLRRLATAGIACPEAIEVRGNVLVMEYLGGDGGWQASPRLKDADIPEERLGSLYRDLLYLLCALYNRCRLVHADLSEYNILYHNDAPYIIDVSQSVEHDHPHALDFLRSDMRNIDSFFARRSVSTIGLKRTFDLVTVFGRRTFTSSSDPAEERRAMDDEVERLLVLPELDEDDELAFERSFIPRTLNEVVDAERDVDLIAAGRGDSLIYANLTGMGGATPSSAVEAPSVMSSEDESGSVGDETGSQTDQSDERGPRKFEDRDANKERKKAVKEERREKRKAKMPKAQKRRAVKKTSGKR